MRSNVTIPPEELTSLNDKTIGANKDSYQEMLLKSWAEAKGLQITIAELADDDVDSCRINVTELMKTPTGILE